MPTCQHLSKYSRGPDEVTWNMRDQDETKGHGAIPGLTVSFVCSGKRRDETRWELQFHSTTTRPPRQPQTCGSGLLRQRHDRWLRRRSRSQNPRDSRGISFLPCTSSFLRFTAGSTHSTGRGIIARIKALMFCFSTFFPLPFYLFFIQFHPKSTVISWSCVGVYGLGPHLYVPQ